MFLRQVSPKIDESGMKIPLYVTWGKWLSNDIIFVFGFQMNQR